MKTIVPVSLGFLALSLAAVGQEHDPAPAFPGQTDAPAAEESTYRVEVITEELSNPWAVAFLPDGNFLVSERAGTLRTVSPDGSVSEPIAGVPGVKIVAAQGFHDVVLDPDFELNRLVYFTYFAPPKGEEAGEWPVEHFYENVWTKSLAESAASSISGPSASGARGSATMRGAWRTSKSSSKAEPRGESLSRPTGRFM